MYSCGCQVTCAESFEIETTNQTDWLCLSVSFLVEVKSEDLLTTWFIPSVRIREILLICDKIVLAEVQGETTEQSHKGVKRIRVQKRVRGSSVKFQVRI